MRSVAAFLLSVGSYPAGIALAASSDPGARGAALPPFPADKSVKQSMMLDGRKLDYIATVGSIALRDTTGAVIGQVVFVAYTLPHSIASRRPVTFSLNGGPGAAQISLNYGAIGPKRVGTGVQGSTPSDSPVAHDNPYSWLGFTDLIFIDPIGTGYSRSLLDDEGTKTSFLTTDTDIHYLSEVIFQWLRANGRMSSPKYLIGESYGGYRVPRIAEYLTTDLSIGVSGIAMVSPALIPWPKLRSEITTPIREMIYLPSETAINFEAHGRTLTPALMAPVEQYARSQYLGDLYAGPINDAATRRVAVKLAELTGLDAGEIRQQEGHIADDFVRNYRRSEGRISSSYDGSISNPAPFPSEPAGDYDDPVLLDDAPREEAMVDFIDRQVGWKLDARYIANNYDLNEKFDRGSGFESAVLDLRKLIANDPKLRILIAHGWTDLSCPYFGSRLIVDQIPGHAAQQVSLRVYPGGHMFYDRAGSASAWKADAMKLYRRD